MKFQKWKCHLSTQIVEEPLSGSSCPIYSTSMGLKNWECSSWARTWPVYSGTLPPAYPFASPAPVAKNPVTQIFELQRLIPIALELIEYQSQNPT
jgi:hypothetical protein